jgi:hypothetical protein
VQVEELALTRAQQLLAVGLSDAAILAALTDGRMMTLHEAKTALLAARDTRG